MTTSTSTHSVKLILNTALWLTALNVVVRASGAVKEIVFAAAFGVSRETDAFVLAVTYSTFLPMVIGSAVGTALVAHFANMRRSRQSELAQIGWGIALAAAACTLLIYTAAPLAMRVLFKLEGEAFEHAVVFARILAPLGIALIMAPAMDALLNSAKQFYFPALIALATPAAMLAAIAMFGREWGVEAAAWGMVAGGLAEVLILTIRIGSQRDGLLRASSLHRNEDVGSGLRDNAHKTLWRSAAFLTFAGMIAALSGIIDQMFLSRLDTGAITNFNYANKVNTLLIGLFGSALSVAIYPYLSDLAASRDMAGLKKLCTKLSAIVLPVTVATTAIVYLFSYQIVDLLFARGNFTADAAREVAAIQQVFAFQLVFYVAGLLAMRVLNATRATDFVLWISCIGLVTNAGFDWLFYRSLGASGIALSSVLTSIVSIVSAVAFIRFELRRV